MRVIQHLEGAYTYPTYIYQARIYFIIYQK